MAQNDSLPAPQFTTGVNNRTNQGNLNDSGYHKLATLMAKGPEIAIFRSFKDLNMINLLRLQAELQEMESRLQKIRQEDLESSHKDRMHYAKDFRLMRDCSEEGDPFQHNLLINIQKKLKEYNVALSQTRELFTFQTPSKRQLTFLRTWLVRPSMGGDFLVDHERTIWAQNNELDLVTVHGPDVYDDLFWSFLSGPVLSLYHRTWGRKPGRKHDEESFRLGAGIRHYDDRRLIAVGHVVSVVVSSLLPTVAILILYVVKPIFARMGLVIAFTALFSIALSTLTTAKRVEIFSATAAFAAVEVVFVGSVSSD